MLLANSVFDGLNAGIGSEMIPRGIKAEDWYVVRNTPGPSVLVELGFLTNFQDAQLLANPEFINKAVLGLSSGIRSFITSIENTEID
jgi:N-acetylmuramoyl-L-alanine amidase